MRSSDPATFDLVRLIQEESRGWEVRFAAQLDAEKFDFFQKPWIFGAKFSCSHTSAISVGYSGFLRDTGRGAVINKPPRIINCALPHPP